MCIWTTSAGTEQQGPCCVTATAGAGFVTGVFCACSAPSPPSSAAPSAGQSLAPPPAPDDAEQQAALLLACSGDTLPASLPPVNMYDLFEALQVSWSCHTFMSQAALPWLPVLDMVYVPGGAFGLSSHSLFPSLPVRFFGLCLFPLLISGLVLVLIPLVVDLSLCKMGELFLCSKAAVIISEMSWTDFDSAAAK